jgi:hypothetical protein
VYAICNESPVNETTLILQGVFLFSISWGLNNLHNKGWCIKEISDPESGEQNTGVLTLGEMTRKALK